MAAVHLLSSHSNMKNQSRTPKLSWTTFVYSIVHYAFPLDRRPTKISITIPTSRTLPRCMSTTRSYIAHRHGTHPSRYRHRCRNSSSSNCRFHCLPAITMITAIHRQLITRTKIGWPQYDTIVEKLIPIIHTTEMIRTIIIWSRAMEISISNGGEAVAVEVEEVAIIITVRKILVVIIISHYIVCTYRFKCFLCFVVLWENSFFCRTIRIDKSVREKNERDRRTWMKVSSVTNNETETLSFITLESNMASLVFLDASRVVWRLKSLSICSSYDRTRRDRLCGRISDKERKASDFSCLSLCQLTEWFIEGMYGWSVQWCHSFLCNYDFLFSYFCVLTEREGFAWQQSWECPHCGLSPIEYSYLRSETDVQSRSITECKPFLLDQKWPRRLLLKALILNERGQIYSPWSSNFLTGGFTHMLEARLFSLDWRWIRWSTNRHRSRCHPCSMIATAMWRIS